MVVAPLLCVRVPDPAAMHLLGVRLATLLHAGDLVILDGDLGAGKTTLVRGIGEGLSVRGPITSPTFVVARQHPSLVGGPALVHVDAYRLGSLAEVDDLDLDSDVDRSVTVVEWGAGRVETLASEPLLIHLVRDDQAMDEAVAHDAGGTRVVTISGGPQWQQIDWPTVLLPGTTLSLC